jgi:hypothetical protein
MFYRCKKPCLTIPGTSRGFRIFTTDPFSKFFESKEGNIAILEMLFSTSLVSLILSPRRLQIMNTKVSEGITLRHLRGNG